MDFTSKEECIEHVSKYLHYWYLVPSHEICNDECNEFLNIYGQCTVGQYYYGNIVGAVNICYNGKNSWEEKVVEIMYIIYRDSQK